MANRLAESLSPYLRQHADNPVDWREWGDDAFAEARRRDVPVLLSVGYAACHWCHVMAHESFEDADVAAWLNADYVAIKVDREERPDVDAVYMAVTQALTGHGGWPMTVVLTPDAEPLFAGTYFPREQFLQVLGTIAQIWRDDRPRALEVGRSIVAALNGRAASSGAVGDVDLTRAVASLRRSFDDARAGFGGAPKFPPSMTLEHLLRHHARTGNADALAMVRRTCEAMARGGMHDQLDGGFARYSVDADWVVPHFEKMLYDNAQLLRVYTHLWRATGDAWARRVALDTAGFLRRRLLTEDGAFASALDADTDGVEGLTYAWTPAQLRELLGEANGARAAAVLGVTDGGTFEHGASTLRWLGELENVDDPWWTEARGRLADARERRPQPARDDKVVTSWNGLAIAALAEAAMILEAPELLDAARRAAGFVMGTHIVEGRLRRTSLGGQVSAALACADDFGNLAEALLVLHQATGEANYLRQAVGLLDQAAALFIDDDGDGGQGLGAGGVFDTGSDADALVVRPRSDGDNAEPSGASSLASAFVMAFALTGDVTYREHAERCLGVLADVMTQHPRFAGWALATAEALADGPVQVAIVESDLDREVTHDHADADEADLMWRAAWQSNRPGLVRVRGLAKASGVPLLEGRPSVDGAATAYVCRGFVCDAPVTTVDGMSV